MSLWRNMIDQLRAQTLALVANGGRGTRFLSHYDRCSHDCFAIYRGTRSEETLLFSAHDLFQTLHAVWAPFCRA